MLKFIKKKKNEIISRKMIYFDFLFSLYLKQKTKTEAANGSVI